LFVELKNKNILQCSVIYVQIISGLRQSIILTSDFERQKRQTVSEKTYDDKKGKRGLPENPALIYAGYLRIG
jgi:hypothetical protein